MERSIPVQATARRDQIERYSWSCSAAAPGLGDSHSARYFGHSDSRSCFHSYLRQAAAQRRCWAGKGLQSVVVVPDRRRKVDSQKLAKFVAMETGTP